MRDINSMSRGNAQLGLPDKGRTIKGLVVCNNLDLEPLDLLNVLPYFVINRPLRYLLYHKAQIGKADCPLELYLNLIRLKGHIKLDTKIEHSKGEREIMGIILRKMLKQIYQILFGE